MSLKNILLKVHLQLFYIFFPFIAKCWSVYIKIRWANKLPPRSTTFLTQMERTSAIFIFSLRYYQVIINLGPKKNFYFRYTVIITTWPSWN